LASKDLRGFRGAVIVCSSLILSNYVVARYPFLSLVEPEDGDYFSKYFSAAGGCLYKLLKFVGILVTVVALGSLFSLGIDSVYRVLVVAYLMVMLGFLIFFNFVYDSIKHPTVTTLIRATLGLGIVLFPFFIPSLVIGSLRCKLLLDSEDF
jgi:hypothetical protein